MPTNWTTTVSSWNVDQVWYSWTTTSSTGSSVYLPDSTWIQETDRMRARRTHDLARERQEQAERYRIEKASRRERALELCRMVLGEEMANDLLEEGSVVITGSDGRKYEVCSRGYSGNVNLLDDEGEQILLKLCAHPSEHHGLPAPDMWLGQILAIVNDAEEFLSYANVHWRRDYRDDSECQRLVELMHDLRVQRRSSTRLDGVLRVLAA